MPLLDARTGRVVLTILLILAGLAFVWAAWHVLVTFLFAIFFAYLVDPVVEFAMRRLKLSRGKAIAVVPGNLRGAGRAFSVHRAGHRR
jgi:predicted PurR-regulated permease PerM